MGRAGNMVKSVTLDSSDVVEDGRLAAIQAILVVAAVVYMLFDFIHFHRYAAYEPATAHMSSWSSWAPPPLNISYPYCHNSTYDLALSPEMSVELEAPPLFNSSCSPVPEPVTITFEPSSFSIVTFLAATPASFVISPESANFFFQHGLLNSGKLGKNPPLSVYGADGTLAMSLPNEELLKLSLKDLLSLAGVDLEQRVLLHPNVPPAFVRLSGVELHMKFEYSNLRPGDFSDDVQCKLTVTAVKGVLTVLGYREVNGVPMKALGVRVVMHEAGEVGRPDAYQTLQHCLNAVVLVTVARVLTSLAFEVLAALDATVRDRVESKNMASPHVRRPTKVAVDMTTVAVESCAPDERTAVE